MWKLLRISALLVVLGVVVAQMMIDRATTSDWDNTLWVGIFPVNGDGSAVAGRYIERLGEEEFASIEQFFASEASRFGLELDRPVRIELYPPLKDSPPLLDRETGALGRAWWSLRLRWFANRVSDVPGRAPAQIRLFVLYHDPETNPQLAHSLGLQKGLVGIVNAFADRSMRGSNAVVIAHEVLHTLGASDKYDPETGLPLHPDGYAEPGRTPLYPQPLAEIMGGRRALSATDAEIPLALTQVRVGSLTAQEIGWTRP